MKLQSAIEFLSTYGFMLLIVALILTVIFYFAIPTQNVLQNQCSIFGSLECNFLIFSTNAPTNANVIFSVSNSGSAPINVIQANVIIGSKAFLGKCTPYLISPGGTSICSAIVTPYKTVGTQVTGYLSIKVNYCNSVISNFGNSVSQSNCVYSPLSYTGEFISYASLVTAKSVSSTVTTLSPFITYSGSGVVGDSITGPTGDGTYICTAANEFPVYLTPYSWIANSNYLSSGHVVSSVGRQGAGLNTCTVPSYGGYENSLYSMAILGLDNAPTPTVTAASNTINSGNSGQIQYTISGPASPHFVVIALSCANLACSYILPPVGCNPVVQQNVGTATGATSYIAVCDYDQNPGTYYINIVASPSPEPTSANNQAWIAAAVYDYGVK